MNVRHAVAVAIVAGIAACSAQDDRSKMSKPSTPSQPVELTMAQKLEKSYHKILLDNVQCKEGASGKWTYVGCRYGGSDAGSMIWYIDGPIAYAANGDARSTVAKLGESWIIEGPRPMPEGVDIQEGMRVTR